MRMVVVVVTPCLTTSTIVYRRDDGADDRLELGLLLLKVLGRRRVGVLLKPLGHILDGLLDRLAIRVAQFLAELRLVANLVVDGVQIVCEGVLGLHRQQSASEPASTHPQPCSYQNLLLVCSVL